MATQTGVRFLRANEVQISMGIKSTFLILSFSALLNLNIAAQTIVEVSSFNGTQNGFTITPSFTNSNSDLATGNPFNHGLDGDNFSRRDFSNTMCIWSVCV